MSVHDAQRGGRPAALGQQTIRRKVCPGSSTNIVSGSVSAVRLGSVHTDQFMLPLFELQLCCVFRSLDTAQACVAWLLLLDYGCVAPAQLAASLFPNLSLEGTDFDGFVAAVNNKRQTMSRDFKDICNQRLTQKHGISVFPAFNPKLLKSIKAENSASDYDDAGINWITKAADGARFMSQDEINAFQAAISAEFGEVSVKPSCQ